MHERPTNRHGHLSVCRTSKDRRGCFRSSAIPTRTSAHSTALSFGPPSGSGTGTRLTRRGTRSSSPGPNPHHQPQCTQRQEDVPPVFVHLHEASTEETARAEQVRAQDPRPLALTCPRSNQAAHHGQRGPDGAGNQGVEGRIAEPLRRGQSSVVKGGLLPALTDVNFLESTALAGTGRGNTAESIGPRAEPAARPSRTPDLPASRTSLLAPRVV